jgi:drug/metabolite transporter (DMT)-like permease
MVETAAPNLHASAYRRSVVMVLLAGVCLSTMGVGIRAIEVANLWQILFYRAAAMTPFLLIVIAMRSGGKPLAAIRAAGPAGILGGGALVFAFAGGIYAFQKTTVANAAFLFAAAPFLAALLGRWILGERLRRATWIFMPVAALGTAVMVGEGLHVGHGIGNASALVAALGFAVFTITLRWKKLDDMMPAVFMSGVIAVMLSGAICLGEGTGLQVPTRDIVIAAALGVFQVGAGLVLYTLGSKAVPAAELALLATSETLLAPLWVWAFLSEIPGTMTLVGGALLMLAIFGNALTGLRRKQIPVL